MTADRDIRLDDVQGIVSSGFGSLPAAAYVLLRVIDARSACRWLEQRLPLVAAADARPTERALNIAFTWQGLQALGVDDFTLRTFPTELREGMTNSHRSRILGDTGANAPEHWAWGGPDTPTVHILLLLFAGTDDLLDSMLHDIRDSAPQGGVALIGEPLATVFLRDPQTGAFKEHFGFADGLAQPFVSAFTRTGRTDRPENTVNVGEFVLGYTNGYGRCTEVPMVPPEHDPRGILPRTAASGGAPDLGTGGTYLVHRQLQQHVQRFWRFLHEQTRAHGGADERIRLASKMVGRFPDGTPLTRSDAPDAERWSRDNGFDYHASDARGLGCPIGAHVRRTNPRDSLEPGPGTAASLEVNNRHRLLRRGRAYGPPVHSSLDPRDLLGPDDSVERGLHFICVSANISRQFEFVQQSWLNNPKFGGLYDDADPISGTGARTFTEQRDPVRRRVCGLPEFVTTRGGAYFFLPGLAALRYLVGLHVTADVATRMQPR